MSDLLITNDGPVPVTVADLQVNDGFLYNGNNLYWKFSTTQTICFNTAGINNVTDFGGTLVVKQTLRIHHATPGSDPQ